MTEEELAHARQVGKFLEEALNYPLFNALPKDDKARTLFHEMRERGCRLPASKSTLQKLHDFYLKRTVENQHELFQKTFGIRLDGALEELLALEYLAAQPGEGKIANTTALVLKSLSQVIDPAKVGLGPTVIERALRKMYDIHYTNVVHRFSLKRLQRFLRAELEIDGHMTLAAQAAQALEPLIIPEELTPAEEDFLQRVREAAGKQALTPLPELEENDALLHPEVLRFMRGLRTFNRRLQENPPISEEQARKFREVSAQLADKILRSFKG